MEEKGEGVKEVPLRGAYATCVKELTTVPVGTHRYRWEENKRIENNFDMH